MPLTSSTKLTFVKFIRPMRELRKKWCLKKKVSRTESLLGYGEASKGDCFFGNNARRIWKKVEDTATATKQIHRNTQVVSAKVSLNKVALLLTETNDGLA